MALPRPNATRYVRTDDASIVSPVAQAIYPNQLFHWRSWRLASCCRWGGLSSKTATAFSVTRPMTYGPLRRDCRRCDGHGVRADL